MTIYTYFKTVSSHKNIYLNIFINFYQYFTIVILLVELYKKTIIQMYILYSKIIRLI